ncbi:MAG TPA: flippase-like domain-containing protein [candidate division Zixibacteria bacterium]|nr:flippase-like domain-containing protein [candidate division Zixibacteria bacterium]
MMKTKTIKQIAGWLLAAVIIYFLAKTIHNNWAELKNWDWRIDWLDAVLAVLFLATAYITASQGWRTILHGFGHHVKLHESFRVVYLANLGRYIPGKVWQVIGMVGLAREVNVPAKTSLASFALVQAYALPASFLLVLMLLGGFDMPASLVVYSNIVYIFMAVVFLLFLILFIWPAGLDWALNKILKLFRQESISYKPSFQNRIAIFIWYIITWLLFGFSFHFFLKALIAQPPLSASFTTGAYIAAYNLGYIAIISPGGLGVREGVMTLLLAGSLGQPIAASIALIHRVLITIAEAVMSLLALLTYKLK